MAGIGRVRGKSKAQKDYAWKRKKELSSDSYCRLRKFVFARDGYTCQLTGKKGGHLEMHHILPYARFPQYRYVAANLITLSKEAHDSIYGRELEYAEFFMKIVEKNQKKFDVKWKKAK